MEEIVRLSLDRVFFFFFLKKNVDALNLDVLFFSVMKIIESSPDEIYDVLVCLFILLCSRYLKPCTNGAHVSIIQTVIWGLVG